MAKTTKPQAKKTRYKHSCATRGEGQRSTEFTWVVKKNSIMFAAKAKATKGEFSSEQVIAMLAWLYGRFGNSNFPLGNTVSKMPDNEVEDGFGKAARLSKIIPAHISYLGPILEDVGILEYKNPNKKIEWQIQDGKTLKDIIGIVKTAKSKK